MENMVQVCGKTLYFCVLQRNIESTWQQWLTISFNMHRTELE